MIILCQQIDHQLKMKRIYIHCTIQRQFDNLLDSKLQRTKPVYNQMFTTLPHKSMLCNRQTFSFKYENDPYLLLSGYPSDNGRSFYHTRLRKKQVNSSFSIPFFWKLWLNLLYCGTCKLLPNFDYSSGL